MKEYEDTSIFQGITQYIADGKQWRREDNGTEFHFFVEIDDAYIFQGSSMKNRRVFGIKVVHLDFIENQECEVMNG